MINIWLVGDKGLVKHKICLKKQVGDKHDRYTSKIDDRQMTYD